MTRTIRRPTRHALPFLVLPALLLALTVPAAAETPAGTEECGPNLAFLVAESPEALLFRPAPREAKQGGEIGGPSALATCTADCGDYPDVTCSGDTCKKVDRNCPDERGYCVADGVTTDCEEPCPVCVADCWDGSTVTCDGSSCSATDSNCGSGIRGSCSDGSSTKYCPPCPCEDSTHCTTKNGSYCSGSPSSSDCSFSDGSGCGSCFCDTSENEWVCTI